MSNGWSSVFRKKKNFFDTFSNINFITNIKYVQIKEKYKNTLFAGRDKNLLKNLPKKESINSRNAPQIKKEH